MKNFKKIIAIFLLLFIVGCGNKELNSTYDNMKIKAGEMNGYSIDLRVYGSVDNENVNKIVRINNFEDKEFKITIINTDIVRPVEGEEYNPMDRNTNIYVKDGVTYVEEDGKAVATTDTKKLVFTNPTIYLDALKNIEKTNSESEEVVATETYTVYDVVVKKDFAKTVLEEVGYNYELTEDVNAKIYVSKDDTPYRIIYTLGDLTVNVNYFGINTSSEIILP